MTIKRNILSLLLTLMTMAASAQQFTLSGRVSDEDGNAIELATIRAP